MPLLLLLLLLLLLVEVAQFKRSSFCLSSSVKYLGELDLLTRKGGRCSERNALSATDKGCRIMIAVALRDVGDTRVEAAAGWRVRMPVGSDGIDQWHQATYAIDVRRPTFLCYVRTLLHFRFHQALDLADLARTRILYESYLAY